MNGLVENVEGKEETSHRPVVMCVCCQEDPTERAVHSIVTGGTAKHEHLHLEKFILVVDYQKKREKDCVGSVLL